MYAPAAYGDQREAYDRGAYSAGGGGSGYYGPPPPQADAYKPAGYSKPEKEHLVNYKRMFFALLLMLALAGLAVGIWAGVTYGRKNGAPAVPPLKPTNFTMSLAAGGKNANGTAGNCTDWFSNSTVSAQADTGRQADRGLSNRRLMEAQCRVAAGFLPQFQIQQLQSLVVRCCVSDNACMHNDRLSAACLVTVSKKRAGCRKVPADGCRRIQSSPEPASVSD